MEASCSDIHLKNVWDDSLLGEFFSETTEITGKEVSAVRRVGQSSASSTYSGRRFEIVLSPMERVPWENRYI